MTIVLCEKLFEYLTELTNKLTNKLNQIKEKSIAKFVGLVKDI